MSYMIVADLTRENARRHVRRAHAHALAGNLDYAAGSLAKAVRNYREARELEAFGDPRFSAMVAKIAAAEDAAFLAGV